VANKNKENQNMKKSYWQNKIIHFLHDPPAKPYFFFPRSGGHKKIAEKLLDKVFQNKELRKRKYFPADYLASGIDRPVFGTKKTIYFHKNPVITHPLCHSHLKIVNISSEDIEKVTLKDVQELNEMQMYALDEIRNNVFQNDENSADSFKLYFILLWRFFKKFLTELKKNNSMFSLFWSYMPADSRIPDHSIWDHNRLTSALSYVSRELKDTYPDNPSHPWLFSFTLKSPQMFLKEARKTQDLWIGSMLIADLTFAAMEPIIEEYGPDVIIYPDLMGNPRADIWLHEQDFNNEYKKWLYNQTYAAVVPHTFVAILPRGKSNTEDNDNNYIAIENIGSLVIDAAHRRWKEYTSLVKSWMEKVCSINTDELWNRIWQDYQDKCPLEPTWFAIPWEPCKKQQQYYYPGRTLPCQDIVQPSEKDCKVIKERFFNLGFWIPEDLWARLEHIRSVFARANESYYLKGGYNYSLLHYKLKQQHKLRNKYSKLTQIKSFTEICTLCKRRNVLVASEIYHDRDNTESRRFKIKKFWSQKELDPEGRGRERLCPVCATKRFLLRAIKEDNQVKSELKHLWRPEGLDDISEVNNIHTFPSTSFLAAQHYLLKFIEHYDNFKIKVIQINRILKQLEEKEKITRTNLISSLPYIKDALERKGSDELKRFLEYNPEMTIYPDALKGYIELQQNHDKDIKQNFKKLHTQVTNLVNEVNEKIQLFPDTHIALLYMDGDSMGELLLGSHKRIKTKWEDVLHPDLVKEIYEKNINLTPGWKEILKLERTINASIHALISRALAEFAHRIVPWVVEQEYHGRLIYAGGDDVLALVPANEALDIAFCLQKLFSAAWVIDRNPGIKSWDWFGGNKNKGKNRFKIVNEEYNEFDENKNHYIFPMLGKSGSISAGIAFGHYKTCLGDFLQRAKEFLEEYAKEKAGRNACAVGYFTRSGIKCCFPFKWKNFNNIIEIINKFQNEKIAMSLPYKLQSYITRIEPLLKDNQLDNKERRKILHGLVKKAMESGYTEEDKITQIITDVLDEALEYGLEEPVSGLFFCRYLASNLASRINGEES